MRNWVVANGCWVPSQTAGARVASWMPGSKVLGLAAGRDPITAVAGRGEPGRPPNNNDKVLCVLQIVECVLSVRAAEREGHGPCCACESWVLGRSARLSCKRPSAALPCVVKNTKLLPSS